MTKKVLLLHGWGGSDFPHWQSWLAGEIAKDYGEVSFLHFSDVDTPKIDIWKKELLDKLQTFQPDIVICHSLANTLWFHLCNEKPLPYVQHLLLVAPPSLSCTIEELKEFFPVEIPKKLYAQNSLLICSTNDPYMDENECMFLKENLKIEMKTIKDGGHLNAQSGYGQWPWIYEEVKRLTKT